MYLQSNQHQRNALINQLLVNGVSNFYIIDIFLQTNKSSFLPDNYKNLNDGDYIIFFKKDRFVIDNSTLLFLLQIADFTPKDKILVIGSDLGFILALLSNMVSTVVCVEEDKEILEITQNNLRNYGINNVQMIHSDFMNLSQLNDNFDGIIVNGAFYRLSNDWALHLLDTKSIIGIHRQDNLSNIVKITKHNHELIWQYYKHCGVPYLKGLSNKPVFTF